MIFLLLDLNHDFIAWSKLLFPPNLQPIGYGTITES